MLRTALCLDESIRSAAAAAAALDLGACRIVNIKQGRVGGVLEARRIHDHCREEGVPVWCGGMLETGVGRALNLALAAMPGFTLPGDTSASARYFEQDLTAAVRARVRWDDDRPFGARDRRHAAAGQAPGLRLATRRHPPSKE